MGDHTVAWQVLVDVIQASLYGCSIASAIEKLEKMQAEASAWMTDLESTGMKLLRLLDLPRTRADLLEDSAGRYAESIKAAKESELESKKLASLGLAIAYHLSYLNYLPFATVPAASQRGSYGGTEGHFRKTLIMCESVDPSEMTIDAKSLPESGSPPALDTEALRKALWGMFAFDAALRESDLEEVIVKSAVTVVAQQVNMLVHHADELASLVSDPKNLVDVTNAASRAASEIHRDATYGAIISAAKIVRDQAKIALDAGLKNQSAKMTSLKKVADAVRGPVEAAEGFVVDLIRENDLAPARAKLILSYLLHKHQRYVAVAYPRCVAACKFLEDPAEAASAELVAQAMRIADFSVNAGKGLSEFAASLLTEYGGLPTVPAGNNWAKHSTGSGRLVVSFNEGQLTVNGRAATPTGVAGMGSHTTAWVVEVEALKAMLTGIQVHVGVLADAVAADLGSEVMKLDALLPGDQLEAGQVLDILDAAQATRQAMTVEDAARFYLQFRNLLPFATLDAGDRGGKAESRGAGLEATFDERSLEHAVALQQEAFTSAKARGAARALEYAQGSLADEITTKRWAADNVVLAAARASRARMKLQAQSLAGNGKILAGIVTEVRWAEHQVQYKKAGMPKKD